jgi:hypothetical protein
MQITTTEFPQFALKIYSNKNFHGFVSDNNFFPIIKNLDPNSIDKLSGKK